MQTFAQFYILDQSTEQIYDLFCMHIHTPTFGENYYSDVETDFPILPIHFSPSG